MGCPLRTGRLLLLPKIVVGYRPTLTMFLSLTSKILLFSPLFFFRRLSLALFCITLRDMSYLTLKYISIYIFVTVSGEAVTVNADLSLRSMGPISELNMVSHEKNTWIITPESVLIQLNAAIMVHLDIIYYILFVCITHDYINIM